MTIDALGQALDGDARRLGFDTPHNRGLGVRLTPMDPFADPALNVCINASLSLPCCRDKYVTVGADSLVFYMSCVSDTPLLTFLDDWVRAWRGEIRGCAS